MKICVLGLEGADPEIILNDERLANLRRLMDLGVYGKLESVLPPTSVPAWICMATSQVPGSLGVYGIRDCENRSHEESGLANTAPAYAPAIWDELVTKGNNAIVLRVSLKSSAAADGREDGFIYPTNLKQRVREFIEDSPATCQNAFSDQKEWLWEEIFAQSEKQWQLVNRLVSEEDWNYFQFVDVGLDLIQQEFWRFSDPEHVHHSSENRFESVIKDYYAHLDGQIGNMLELLDSETILLIVSDHGGQRSSGGFAVNSSRDGIFVLVAPNNPLSGEYQGAKLLDIAPTLLDLAGHEIPQAMQGRSLVEGMEKRQVSDTDPDEEKMLLDRLSGLGYV